MTEVLLTLKIGKRSFDITEKTKFLTNSVIVEILEQGRDAPVLRDKHLKLINKFKRNQHKHEFGDGTSIFSLTPRSSI